MIVRFSRTKIEVVGDDVHYASESLLTLLPQRGEPCIMRVGGTEEEVRSEFLACGLDGRRPASLKIVSPGDAPWWDAQYAWPRKTTELEPPADDSEALLLNPLSANTWSPPFILSLLRYALARSSPKGMRWIRWPFTRPRLAIQFSADFTTVESAELLDVVDDAWGRAHVLVPSEISRLPRSQAQLIWWASFAAVVAMTIYAVSHHWSPWQRAIVTLVVLSPAFIAKRKQEQLARSAPRRRAAQTSR